MLELLCYCKSGNIRGTLIFRVFRANSASANSKTRENICRTKMTSEHLLSANLTTREYVFVLPNAKI